VAVAVTTEILHHVLGIDLDADACFPSDGEASTVSRLRGFSHGRREEEAEAVKADFFAVGLCRCVGRS
jgi:hypothetical protein